MRVMNMALPWYLREPGVLNIEKIDKTVKHSRRKTAQPTQELKDQLKKSDELKEKMERNMETLKFGM